MIRATQLTAVLACLAASPAAYAHFKLVAPASRSGTVGTNGDPQKSAPCGQADPGTPETPTGIVTTFKSGSMITVTIDERITHPGHYRVALAPDDASLPPEPKVTAGDMDCGTTVIAANPTLPLLADGLFVHTAAFKGPQTASIQLPAGMTCNHCTLQVLEFMSDHGLNVPGGCFYHHCATVNVTAEGPGPDAGGGGGGGDGGGGAPGTSSGCDARGGGSSGLVALLVGFAAARRRRRRA